MVDWGLVFGGLAVGIVVGLTGMGGGALMTPMLVVFFGINPLAAVSSDLVTTAVMKPFGGAVHAARRTVDWRLVKWLVLGSVPSAFAGVFVLRALGEVADIEDIVLKALGVTLLLAACTMISKAYLTMIRRARAHRSPSPEIASAPPTIDVRPLPTVLVGVVGGLVVGMTSVGSGSLIIVALMLLYPVLGAAQLVGTDLVQAVPLVAAAAVGHLLYGEFQFDVAASLVIGSVPGTIIGALLSSRAPSGLIRRALALILLASSLKLLGVSAVVTAVVLVGGIVLGPLLWMAARKHHGLTPTHHRTKRLQDQTS